MMTGTNAGKELYASPTPISLHDRQIHGAATPAGTILTGG